MNLGWLVAWVALGELLLGYLASPIGPSFAHETTFFNLYRELILAIFGLAGALFIENRRTALIEAGVGLAIYLICMQEFRGPVRLDGILDDMDKPMTYIWWISAGVSVGLLLRLLYQRSSKEFPRTQMIPLWRAWFIALVSAVMFVYQWVPMDKEFPYSEFPFTRWWVTTAFLLVTIGFVIYEYRGENETARI